MLSELKCPKCGRVRERPEELHIYKAMGCISCTADLQLYDWNYVPRRFYFHELSKQPTTKFFMGVELEIDHNYNESVVPLRVPTAISKRMRGYNKQCYFMYDGSIAPGYEMVMHPRTFESWMSPDNPIWKYITLIRKHENLTTNNASLKSGLHIHISKQAISRTQLYKMLRFVYSNYPYMMMVAHRDFRFSHMNGKYFCKFDSYDAATKAKLKSWNDRYTVVNLKPIHTIEFRCFRSTVNENQIRLYLQFVHALWRWTNEVGITKRFDMLLASFIKFVAKNKATYPQLELFNKANYKGDVTCV
jgi:hypothetical protein